MAPHCGWSTPELFEIWHGRTIIYGQEKPGDDPGSCVAIEAGPGERVVMPPGWSHFVANADSNSLLIFGAWCDRQYGFDYRQMRAHHGLAWFPLLAPDGKPRWEPIRITYHHNCREKRREPIPSSDSRTIFRSTPTCITILSPYSGFQILHAAAICGVDSSLRPSPPCLPARMP